MRTTTITKEIRLHIHWLIACGFGIPKNRLRSSIHLLIFSFIVLSLFGCASHGRIANHSFSFDVRGAVPAVELLEYRYGNSDLVGTRTSKWQIDAGVPGQWSSIYGPIVVGDFLYARWRIESTGQVVEETVDLKNRLPRNMDGQEVCFHIVGSQIYIYLVEPFPLPPSEPDYIIPGIPLKNPPFAYRRKFKVIFPDQFKSSI